MANFDWMIKSEIVANGLLGESELHTPYELAQ